MPPKLSEEIVKALPAPETGNRVHYFAGATLQGFKAPRGFGVRVTAGGARSFVLNYRLKGREFRYTVGAYPDWPVIRAVKLARELRQRVDRGENPQDDRKPVVVGTTVGNVLDDFIAEHARGKARPLRGVDAIESTFRRLVKPAIGGKGVVEITKDEIIGMRQRIGKSAGPVAADRTFAYFRAAMRWFANGRQGGDAFDVRKLAIERLTSPKDRERQRCLSPAEIKIIWPRLEAAGTFGALCKVLLLTGQRRSEVAGMRRQELIEDGLWEIPAERFKGKRPHAVPLSAAVATIITAQLKASGCDYPFPSSADTPFTGFGKAKAALDKAVLAAKAEIAPWTLHDLRRTARTLMSEIGVRAEIAEHVLGHALGTLARTYDRHGFLAEKRDALDRLATRIDRIVNPPPSNVTDLDQKRPAAIVGATAA
jgi:integrase